MKHAEDDLETDLPVHDIMTLDIMMLDIMMLDIIVLFICAANCANGFSEQADHMILRTLRMIDYW
jgi:hypothetical protein